jgi:hypothetical protein
MTSLSCPVCGIDWPGHISVCPCGYAPDDLDGFRRRLEVSRKRGAVLQLGGTAMMAPLALLLAFGSGMWLVPALASVGVAIGGLVIAVRGTRQLQQSTKRLRALAELRQLPAARVR